MKIKYQELTILSKFTIGSNTMKRKIIPNKFKYARLNAGYTQDEVSAISGFITIRALSNYETGYVFPSNKVLYVLPKLYQVSLDYLFCEDPYPDHDEFIIQVLLLDKTSLDILKRLKAQDVPLHDLYTYITNLKNGDDSNDN